MLRVRQPVRPVGDEAPGANLRDAIRERVDVAVAAVEGVDVTREPVGRDRAGLHQEAIELADEIGVPGRRNLAVIRNLAHLPQALDGSRSASEIAQLGVPRYDVE